MLRTVAFLRNSQLGQSLAEQREVIGKFAEKKRLVIDRYFELAFAPKGSPGEKGIEPLLEILSEGDTLVVSDLSSLGRFLGQAVIHVAELISRRILLIAVAQDLIFTRRPDMAEKAVTELFTTLAAVERKLISGRTREGLAKARASGKSLGRPVGWRGSKLDAKEQEIRHLLELKVSKASISKITGVTPPTLHHYLRSRNISI